MTIISRVSDFITFEKSKSAKFEKSLGNIHGVINGGLTSDNFKDKGMNYSLSGASRTVGSRLLADGAINTDAIEVDDNIDFGGNKGLNLKEGTSDKHAVTVGQINDTLPNGSIATQNLLGNSIKFGPSRVVDITLDRENNSNLSDNAKAVNITCNWTNNGAGTDQAFFRVKHSNRSSWATISSNDVQDSDGSSPNGTVSIWWTFDSNGQIDIYFETPKYPDVFYLPDRPDGTGVIRIISEVTR